ncbi:MAG: DUF1559 domain-containing protein [Pirellulales bacterium]|nr:DUF1559 domain-containing protein [Pirellulales bacterium]
MVRNQRGFTLVELLVVISIIAMLAGLILPAVNQAREAGRRTVCLNNQKQLSSAVLQYELKQGYYPGYVNPQAFSHEAAGATRPIGWMFSILPFLERNDIYDLYGQPGLAPIASGNSAAVTIPPSGNTPGGLAPLLLPNFSLKVAVCPSDERAPTVGQNATPVAEQTFCSYVVNCGLKDLNQNAPSLNPITGAAAPRDWLANGVFFSHFNYMYPAMEYRQIPNPTVPSGGNLLPCPRVEHELLVKMTQSYIGGVDGTATTFMLTENVDCGNWTDPWEQSVGVYWQPGFVGSTNVPGPSVNQYDFLLVPLKRINENAGGIDSDPNSLPAYGRPSSRHPGLVVATFCDGHSQTIGSEIDYLVYCQLMTSRGKEAQPAGARTYQYGSFMKIGGNYRAYTNTQLSEGSY